MGHQKGAPEIGDTIKFRKILMFENAFDPSLHVSPPCSKVELNTFSSNLLIKDIVPDSRIFLESTLRCHLLLKQILIKSKP